MTTRMWRVIVHYRFYLAAACLVGVLIAGASGANSPGVSLSAQAPAGQATPPAQPAGYVGSDTCVVCHSDKEDSLKGTQHAKAMNPRTPAATQGCESCHGPGQAHVDDDAKGNIRKFAQITPAETNETCLGCHNRGDHAGWGGSAHEARNLSCGTCHSVHSPKSPARQLVKSTQTELCAGCHRLQVVKTERAVEAR
jgi:DmsE family decaheme c-type cytochrome